MQVARTQAGRHFETPAPLRPPLGGSVGAVCNRRPSPHASPRLPHEYRRIACRRTIKGRRGLAAFAGRYGGNAGAHAVLSCALESAFSSRKLSAGPMHPPVGRTVDPIGRRSDQVMFFAARSPSWSLKQSAPTVTPRAGRKLPLDRRRAPRGGAGRDGDPRLVPCHAFAPRPRTRRVWRPWTRDIVCDIK